MAHGFLVAQAWFAVHHLGLVVLLVALARSRAVGPGRVARGGAWLAAAGMVLLSGTELLAMRYAEWGTEAANAGLIGSAYGIVCTAIGLGTIAAGLGVLRTRTWSGWHAGTALVIGVSQFLVLTPGMFSGFEVARLAIGFWMLTFAALGWSMYAEARPLPVASAQSGQRVRSFAGAVPSGWDIGPQAGGERDDAAAPAGTGLQGADLGRPDTGNPVRL